MDELHDVTVEAGQAAIERGRLRSMGSRSLHELRVGYLPMADDATQRHLAM